MVDAVKLGGVVLDLQVIRPNPTVEVDGKVVCEIDGELLFRMADAATAAVDALIRAGELVEQAIDHHDVRGHYASGADLIATFAGRSDNSRRALCPRSAPLRSRAWCASAADCDGSRFADHAQLKPLRQSSIPNAGATDGPVALSSVDC